jgi:hypothetical protein
VCARQILEWTESPEQALEFSIYLNDKWELDGRDPNGWVGCMWSICGIHDQARAILPCPSPSATSRLLYRTHWFLEWCWGPLMRGIDLAPCENESFLHLIMYGVCMWAMTGPRFAFTLHGLLRCTGFWHAQGWAERPVFGKIRYMNAKGCARKFDVKAYVKRVNEMMEEVKAKQAGRSS